MLADQLGITIPEAMKKAEKGTITASQAIPALVEGMSAKFGGMMEKQSSSLLGLWSTARDNIGASLRVIGDTLVTTFDLKTKLAGANKWLGELAKTLKDGGISGALSKIIPENLHAKIVMVAGALAGAMAPALLLVAVNAAKALIPLTPWIVAGGLLAGAIYLVVKNWDNLGVRIAAVVAVIGGALILFTNMTLILKLWAAWTKIVTAAQVVWNAVMTANPIGLVIVGIAALIAVGVLLYKNWDAVKRNALNAWGAIKSTVLTSMAAITEAYGKFVGMFNQATGDRIKASAEAMRRQATAESDLVDQRTAGYEADVQLASDAEEAKWRVTSKRAADQARANEAAGAAEVAVWDQTTVAASDAKETKKDYLDEFAHHFSRTQDALLTEFSRAQDDQTEAFKRGQEERLKAFDAGQAEELAGYQRVKQESVDIFKHLRDIELEQFRRSQEDKKNVFEGGLDDEKQTFERHQDDLLQAFKRTLDGEQDQFRRAQQDRRNVFESGLDDEKQTFERHQEDLLNAFKQRQSDEIQALQGRQEAERRALDADYAARIDALDAEQKAMERAAQAEARAKQEGAAQGKVDTAQKDVGRATALNDPELLAQAQKRLAEALAAQAELLAKGRQDDQKNRITDEKDAIKTEWDQRKQALKDEQDSDIAAAKERQQAKLVAYQRELDDEKTAFATRRDERKQAFSRMQEDELAAYRLRQEEALKAYQLGQEDEKVAFSHREEERKLAYGRMQEDELTVYRLRQEEALKAYQRDVDDELTAYKTRQDEAKLHYQRRQEDEMTAWKRAQEDRTTHYKQELDDLKDSFKDKLGEQQDFVNDWNRMAARMQSMRPDLPTVPDVPSSRSSASSGSATPIMMAAGGIAKRPVVMGEAGAEVFAPLGELWKQLQDFGATIGARMANLVLPAIASMSLAMPRAAMASPAGSDAPIILHFTNQTVLDGEMIGEYVVEKTFGTLQRQRRAFGLG